MLLAIIRPSKLQAVKSALERVGVTRMTVYEVQGVGRQRGQTESYRGIEYQVNLLRKITLEIVVNDDFVQRTVETIERVARTGNDGTIGDGKIFVLPVEQAVRNADAVRGPEAV